MTEHQTEDKKAASILLAAAKNLIARRYPSGPGGAAAVLTDAGNIHTGIAPETVNDSLALCMETGAYLEAEKANERVTHSLCLYRESADDEFMVLTACGICQERLRYWGGNVRIAVSNPEHKVIFRTLEELSPHHWSQVNSQ